VVDLDIELVAHINSGSYRGEAETHQKRKTTFKHVIDAQTTMMIRHENINGAEIKPYERIINLNGSECITHCSYINPA
jgi:hypothetical protein